MIRKQAQKVPNYQLKMTDCELSFDLSMLINFEEGGEINLKLLILKRGRENCWR